MRRFRSKRRPGQSSHGQAQPIPVQAPSRWLRELDARLENIPHLCHDTTSRSRLVRLRERLVSQKREVREAAQAEVELARLLVRAGFSVSFLPESRSRTADLECYLGLERVFVEVTVIVKTDRQQQIKSLRQSETTIQDIAVLLEAYDRERLLVKRIVSRIAEKARQLSDYCAPVVLAITVPHLNDSPALAFPR